MAVLGHKEFCPKAIMHPSQEMIEDHKSGEFSRSLFSAVAARIPKRSMAIPRNSGKAQTP